jgi:hypothetical protein
LSVREALMGDIIRPGKVPMQLAAEVIGTAPIDRVDVLHGTRVAQTVRPFAAADLGRRVRVLWQGAEYRGRGRETVWQGKLTLTGNRFLRFAPVNFLNPERKVHETKPGNGLAWTSVTTGNLAGVDLWLGEARRGTLTLDTNVVSGEVDLTTLADDTVVFDGGGLGRRISVYYLPERDWSRHLAVRSRRDVPGRRRSSGLCARDASRRPSGLVESNLSHRLTRAAKPAPPSCQGCTARKGNATYFGMLSSAEAGGKFPA